MTSMYDVAKQVLVVLQKFDANSRILSSEEISKELGINQFEIYETCNYLQSKGFIKSFNTSNFDDGEKTSYGITEKGLIYLKD